MGQAKRLSEDAHLESSKRNSQAAKKEEHLWFVARGYVLKGPYSTAELVKKINEEEISEKLFAWRDSYKEWRPLYSIDELKAELEKADNKKEASKLVELFLYPTVPIPGSPVAVAEPTEGQATKKPLRDSKVIKVRFSNSKFASLKKSEAVSVFLFTLCFAYLIVLYSFDKFYDRFSTLWGARHSGELYQVGNFSDEEDKNTVPTSWWNPLLSAPGIRSDESHWVSAEVEGIMQRKDPSAFAGRHLEVPIPQSEYLENMNWDKEGIYQRQMKVQGFVDLKNPQRFVVELEGMPFKKVIPQEFKISEF